MQTMAICHDFDVPTRTHGSLLELQQPDHLYQKQQNYFLGYIVGFE